MFAEQSARFSKKTDRFVDRFNESERVVVFFQNILKFDELTFIDDADDQIFFGIGVDAFSFYARGGVPQFFQNFPIDFIGVRGNDQKFVSGFAAANDHVCDEAVQEAVEHAQADGFIIEDECAVAVVFSVDEDRNEGDDGIDGKIDPKEIEHRIFFTDVFGNDVGATRRAISAEHSAVNEPAHCAGDQDGIDGIDSLGVILQGRQVKLFQDNIADGVRHGKDERFDGKFAIDEEESEDTEGGIDDNGKVADIEIQFIFEHGTDPVKPCRSEVIANNE